MDRYTKVVLTLIAFALWANLLMNTPLGHGLIREAQAQAMTQTVIQGTMRPLPVYLVASADNATPGGPLAVNLSQLSGRAVTSLPVDLATVAGRPASSVPVDIASFGGRAGAALPVDLEFVGATAVRASDGVPVNLGSRVVQVNNPAAQAAQRAATATTANQSSSSQTGTSTSTTAPPPSNRSPGG